MELLAKQFLTLSGAITNFDEFTLQGTGQAQAYFDTTVEIVGGAAVEELLCHFQTILDNANDENSFYSALRRDVMAHVKLGPIARNIIKLWYTGTWYQMPARWREAYGESERDTTFFVSSASYMEGLLWLAIGANPSGAKGPGYGSWSEPPRIQANNTWQFTESRNTPTTQADAANLLK